MNIYYREIIGHI